MNVTEKFFRIHYFKGINLQSSYHGIHIVSEVKIHSPADICGKIDAGDEILQVKFSSNITHSIVLL